MENSTGLVILLLFGILAGGFLFSKEFRYKFFEFLGKMGKGTRARPGSTSSNSIDKVAGVSGDCVTCKGRGRINRLNKGIIICPTCEGTGKSL